MGVVVVSAFGFTGAARSVSGGAPTDAAAFTDRADWNPFANADVARRYQVIMTPLPDESEAPGVSAISAILTDLSSEDLDAVR
jgi:hypothetical protein